MLQSRGESGGFAANQYAVVIMNVHEDSDRIRLEV